MVADDPASADPAEAAAGLACRPCHGTGSVISNLGGSQGTVPCPWCEGTGRFIPEHDAQARLKAAGSASADDEAAD